jgi:hypothetical protein
MTSARCKEERTLSADPYPRGDFEAMLESDVQDTAEHEVEPKRDLGEKLASPKDCAIIVRGDDPEEGEFVPTTLETGAAHEPCELTQKENALEKPFVWVMLTVTARENPVPEMTFCTMDDEDNHLVENVEE